MARTINQIMGKITEMSNDMAEKDLFAMLYSEFGAGKTTTIMGLAQAIRGDGKILFLDSSDGFVVLDEFPALKEGASRFRVDNPADLLVIANGLKSGKLKGYTVAVIDEASSIFQVMLEQYMRDKYSLGPDDQLPEMEGSEYGPPTAALESILRKFHDIEGLHVLITAHAREVGESRNSANKELRPDFSPKAYTAVMRKLHVCGALTARRKKAAGGAESYERTIQLKPSAAVAAKSRIPESPTRLDPIEFIELVSEWVAGESFVDDTQGKATKQELASDSDDEPEPEDAPEPDDAAGDVDYGEMAATAVKSAKKKGKK